MSGLTSATQFGKLFLNNCINLLDLKLPLTSGAIPALYSKTKEPLDAWGNFISYYNGGNFVIHCGSKLNDYKTAAN
ncbi:MAG: hypothetical protein HUJ68_11065 [Clostridia bacterium]|nr:hypothetical protein [Clostridia bacterium]